MNLNGRLVRIERTVVPPDVDGPASILELVTGTRDIDYRRRIGRAAVRDAVLRMREVIARIDADQVGSESEGSCK